jgi:hypothetical protein
MGTRVSFGAALGREAGAVVLSLYAGVPGPQGTDNDIKLKGVLSLSHSERASAQDLYHQSLSEPY